MPAKTQKHAQAVGNMLIKSAVLWVNHNFIVDNVWINVDNFLNLDPQAAFLANKYPQRKSKRFSA
ncbi:hypothetical protein BC351_20750 [Paenibacillus ferrarius]|uniref:Uncharacterized protein n=1 Tax=Paenibacillus ferrarius TaxID=1469647 RepID=A0A1V4HPG0_9BACL|nr:hypothetical protein BC351_20750 [Paenibacillus ferrarius]